MLKQLSLTAMVAAIFAAVFVANSVSPGYAQSDPNKMTIRVDQTATTGKQMFTNYCAPCHGADGKGHGPVASALKTAPMDLTMLTKNNGGKFPDDHVAAVLKFGSDVPAHGTSQMPVWGPILGRLNQSDPMAKALRMSNLSTYLKSIQQK